MCWHLPHLLSEEWNDHLPWYLAHFLAKLWGSNLDIPPPPPKKKIRLQFKEKGNPLKWEEQCMQCTVHNNKIVNSYWCPMRPIYPRYQVYLNSCSFEGISTALFSHLKTWLNFRLITGVWTYIVPQHSTLFASMRNDMGSIILVVFICLFQLTLRFLCFLYMTFCQILPVSLFSCLYMYIVQRFFCTVQEKGKILFMKRTACLPLLGNNYVHVQEFDRPCSEQEKFYFIVSNCSLWNFTSGGIVLFN